MHRHTSGRLGLDNTSPLSDRSWRSGSCSAISPIDDPPFDGSERRLSSSLFVGNGLTADDQKKNCSKRHVSWSTKYSMYPTGGGSQTGDLSTVSINNEDDPIFDGREVMLMLNEEPTGERLKAKAPWYRKLFTRRGGSNKSASKFRSDDLV